ncbi:glycosyltransferase [Aeromonas jandaei]|uniref:Glycosyltransferase n=1 Tax=Aeromonas jandaei TaxID=650 RepID=A0A7T4AAQ5_AERJA|nr:glycosyltransferase [Aeromonas jandaei]QQB20430.1 glycosyltransferase [Aeromonas jandaei]UCA35130.1 glycosyltransferase [Aeromonas jandaei]
MESIIVFGSGGLFKSFQKYIYDVYNVSFFLDNDYSKHGLYINGSIIVKPDASLCLVHEKIIVASFFFDEIKQQLINLGVCTTRISNIADETQLLAMAFSDIKDNANTSRVNSELKSIVSSTKRDILFIVNSMVMGGSELSLLNTLKTIDYSKNRVILVIINGGGTLTTRIPDDVVTIEIYKTPNECAMQQCLFRYLPANVLYNTYINRCFDIVVSYTIGSSAKLACAIPAHKKIAWIHSDFSVSHPTKSNFISIEDEVNCYNEFTEIVFVSNSALNGFNLLFKGVDVKKTVMGNIFDVKDVVSKSALLDVNDHMLRHSKKKYEIKFIFVGRLSKEKGIIRLLNAFESALKVNDNLQLIIVGHGNLFLTVQSIILDRGIDNNVVLIGECDNPYPYMRSADILILPSYYEGQPLVIGEAFILGLPIIATGSKACREMLRDGEFGLVVENNERGIFNGICQAMSQEDFIPTYTKKSQLGLFSLKTKLEDDFFS